MGTKLIEEMPNNDTEITKLKAISFDLFNALIAIIDNRENWLETGESATEEESKKLYDNAKAAINKATKG